MTQTTSSESADPVIDALLAPSEPVSIIDGLLDLPRAADAGNEWERAARGRLEARLAQRMRHVIEARPGDLDLG